MSDAAAKAWAVFFARAVLGLIFFLAWLAGTGRVAYIMIMLWIAAGLAYAVLDLVDYEVVKRERRG